MMKEARKLSDWPRAQSGKSGGPPDRESHARSAPPAAAAGLPQHPGQNGPPLSETLPEGLTWPLERSGVAQDRSQPNSLLSPAASSALAADTR